MENLGVDMKIILKWIFKRWDREAWAGLLWLRTVTLSGACECFIKYGDFVDELRNC